MMAIWQKARTGGNYFLPSVASTGSSKLRQQDKDRRIRVRMEHRPFICSTILRRSYRKTSEGIDVHSSQAQGATSALTQYEIAAWIRGYQNKFGMKFNVISIRMASSRSFL
jgi:hypothetical protein